jgi:hypothetical protein
MGSATPASNPAIGFSGSGGVSCRARKVASWAAMMLPPETDVNVSIWERIPSSFSRRRAPRWKSAAR